MKYYDHRHINGVDLRRILTPEPPRRPGRTVAELLALVACLAALVLLFAWMQ